jgi:hypothetical protein
MGCMGDQCCGKIAPSRITSKQNLSKSSKNYLAEPGQGYGVPETAASLPVEEH